MRELAIQSTRRYARVNNGFDARDPLLPWAISMIAREALVTPGKATRRSPGRRNISGQELDRLGAYALALSDPLSAVAKAPGAIDGFLVRMAFQQFSYQEPSYHSIARMRPMFDRDYPAGRFSVLSKESLKEVLGGRLDVFVDSAPFFVAAAMANQGNFSPKWLEGSQFDEVRERIDLEELRSVFDIGWSASRADLRAEAIRAQSQDLQLRQHDWNPFVGRPFMQTGEGQYIAPQAWYVASRVSPSAVYYLGLDRYGEDWTRDLGQAHEDYILRHSANSNPPLPCLMNLNTRLRTGKLRRSTVL